MSSPAVRSLRRMAALVRKESLQVLRDPAALLIAFVMPPVLLFMFAFAISLDVDDVPIGLILEQDGHYAHSLASAYDASSYLEVTAARHRREVERMLVTGDLKALVIIPQDFDAAMLDPHTAAQIQIISDGSSPNSANFAVGYARAVFNGWLADHARTPPAARIDIEPRFWFNAELESRQVLVPAAIALVMTMIGTLLTALVVSREWERGTMEAIMSTPSRTTEIIFSKLLPYFLLGIMATLGCAFLGVWVFGIPLRGSLLALLAVSCVFLVPALGQGLLISTLSRNQFVSTQMAVMTGFLPATFLSGFIFEIQGMPEILQFITHIIPARYYITSLQTIFLAGDLWEHLRADMLGMLSVGVLFFGITLIRSRRGLDS